MLNRKVLFRHVLVWTIYIIYELALIQITLGLTASYWHYGIFYLMNIGLFYFNAHVILDYAFFKTSRSYLVATLLILLEIFIYLILKLWVENVLIGKSTISLAFTPGNIRLWLSNIFREIFFIGFSIAYWSLLYMVKFKEVNHALEKDHLRNVAKTLELENKYITAENAYLQNQISPHLLFNSLNFLYNTIHRLSDRAGKGVMLLSEIMRYSLVSSTDQRTVPLKEEAEQITKLIELTSLRFENGVFLKFTKKGSIKEIVILPLILVTLVENMIKHGDLGEVTQPGIIRLTVSDHTLIFETRNKKRSSSPHPKSGIGLANIRKRLNNHYPERFQFDVTDTPNEFIVLLTIDL